MAYVNEYPCLETEFRLNWGFIHGSNYMKNKELNLECKDSGRFGYDIILKIEIKRMVPIVQNCPKLIRRNFGGDVASLILKLSS